MGGGNGGGDQDNDNEPDPGEEGYDPIPDMDDLPGMDDAYDDLRDPEPEIVEDEPDPGEEGYDPPVVIPPNLEDPYPPYIPPVIPPNLEDPYPPYTPPVTYPPNLEDPFPPVIPPYTPDDEPPYIPPDEPPVVPTPPVPPPVVPPVVPTPPSYVGKAMTFAPATRPSMGGSAYTAQTVPNQSPYRVRPNQQGVGSLANVLQLQKNPKVT